MLRWPEFSSIRPPAMQRALWAALCAWVSLAIWNLRSSPASGRALWCSADPVCMEIGTQSGQGPDSCNLAACHNCCLVPETACEEFNRFLDRGVVVGSLDDRRMGFFDGLLWPLPRTRPSPPLQSLPVRRA